MALPTPLASRLCPLAILAVALAAAGSPAAPAASGAARTTVAVTVGAPTETSVRLSRSSSIPAGTVVFQVTNRGHAAHGFKLCSAPSSSRPLPSTCAGRSVTLARAGQTATLTVALRQGTYVFLATVSGQSIAGREGLVGIGVKAPAATQAIPNAPVTGTPGGGKPAAPPVFPTGNPANGATVFAGALCGTCHTLLAAGATGDGGPNLDALKPTLSDVETQVYNGGDPMPSFALQLSAQQIADVAAYVVQSTHPA